MAIDVSPENRRRAGAVRSGAQMAADEVTTYAVATALDKSIVENA
jgi:hypothetical protein